MAFPCTRIGEHVREADAVRETVLTWDGVIQNKVGVLFVHFNRASRADVSVL